MKKKKLGHILVVGLLVLFGNFALNEVVNANENEVDLSSVSKDLMPKEVRDVVEKLNSDNKKGNQIDGFITNGDPNASIYTQNSNDFVPFATLPGQTKSNVKKFGYSDSGNSVINITVGNPGFWKSLYQNKYDGFGYTTQLKGSYTPSKAVATVNASATGAIPNISFSGSSWGLFNTTKRVGYDSSKWSTRAYAMAHADDVRIQNISNLTVKFEVKSELHYSAVGSRTTYNSVRFW